MKLYCTIEIDETMLRKVFEPLFKQPTAQLKSENLNQFLTCSEAAKEVGYSTQTVWRWCRNGELPHLRIKRVVRIRRAELLKFIEKQTL